MNVIIENQLKRLLSGQEIDRQALASVTVEDLNFALSGSCLSIGLSNTYLADVFDGRQQVASWSYLDRVVDQVSHSAKLLKRTLFIAQSAEHLNLTNPFLLAPSIEGHGFRCDDDARRYLHMKALVEFTLRRMQQLEETQIEAKENPHAD